MNLYHKINIPGKQKSMATFIIYKTTSVYISTNRVMALFKADIVKNGELFWGAEITGINISGKQESMPAFIIYNTTSEI